MSLSNPYCNPLSHTISLQLSTGQSFIIDKDGAVLGRKVTNTIPLLMKVSCNSSGSVVVTV